MFYREIKQTDSRIDSLERRIEEEAKRLDRYHPLEAKQIADILEQEISATEQVIQGLFSDVQTLRDGRYQQASELHKRWVFFLLIINGLDSNFKLGNNVYIYFQSDEVTSKMGATSHIVAQ